MAEILLDSVPSTNTWAKEHSADLAHGDVVITHCQTSGRGQRGNSWEAEPGKNLTFTLCMVPEGIAPANQFVISEIVSLAVVETLARHLHPAVTPERIKVKWPNDIYVDDRKIAGILIEHTLRGNSISQTIAGIGLNVNQKEFLSPAPNPVSMIRLSGREHDLETLLRDVVEGILQKLAHLDGDAIHQEYLSRLWRHDGAFHSFVLPDGEIFQAAIADVSPSGMLTLVGHDGSQQSFAFKEVGFVI